ncbi:MAG: hypothetical protein U9R24_08040 [Thermodesulfobacteriota bacterium]|nr:hypothetical protein [Thermodesulfobacteriota bacterium]
MEGPDYAIITARLKSGKRCWAQTEKDGDLFSAMEREEFIEKEGIIIPGDDSPNIMKFYEVALPGTI